LRIGIDIGSTNIKSGLIGVKGNIIKEISVPTSNAPDHILFEPLETFVRKHCYQMIAKEIRIEKSALGDKAPLIGAALLDEDI